MVDNAYKALNELNNHIRALKQRLNELNDQKEEFFSQKDGISTQIKNLITQVKESKGKRNVLTDEVKSSKKSRDSLNKELQQKIKVLKELRAQLPKGGGTQSPSYLLRDIERIDEHIETNAISFDQEKKLMKKIKELKKIYNEQKEEMKGWEEMHGVSKDVDRQRQQADTVHRSIQLKAKESQKEHENIIAISTRIDDLRKKEAEARKKFLDKKKEFTQVNDELKEKLIGIGKLSADLSAQRKNKENKKKEKRINDLQELIKLAEEKLAKGEKLTNEDLLALRADS